MKLFANITRVVALSTLAACLMTVPASAKSKKLHSIDALAQALAAKIPQEPGTIVYVAFPGWKGKEKHFLLCKEIGKELTEAFAKALPDDKIYTPADAARILAKTGIQPLDVYFDFPWGRYGGNLVAMMGGEATVASLIAEDGSGLRVTVSVWKVQGDRRLVKESMVVAASPRIRELLALPDRPVKDSSGVYKAGIGGIGSPRCLSCPKPPVPLATAERMESGTIFVGLTVRANGSLADITVLGIKTKRPDAGMAESAIHTIRTWRLSPAVGPDKKPVPTRVLVEIEVVGVL
jgi:hypothetical protein